MIVLIYCVSNSFSQLYNHSNNSITLLSAKSTKSFGVFPALLIGCLFCTFSMMSLHMSNRPNSAALWSGVCPKLSAGFLFWTSEGLPEVTVKWASELNQNHIPFELNCRHNVEYCTQDGWENFVFYRLASSITLSSPGKNH